MDLPSGNPTKDTGKSPSWVGKSTINGTCLIAMSNYQRVICSIHQPWDQSPSPRHRDQVVVAIHHAAHFPATLPERVFSHGDVLCAIINVGYHIIQYLTWDILCNTRWDRISNVEYIECNMGFHGIYFGTKSYVMIIGGMHTWYTPLVCERI